jgi:hypothetical protein
MTHDPADLTRTHEEHVVLDIGDGVGALLLYTPDAYRGHEIEVSPVGNDVVRTHTAVLERRVAGRTLCAAVYPALAAGEWRIWGNGPERPDRILIEDGGVAEVDWR